MSFFGLSRPARSAGLALLAVGVIAAVVGGIMLATGDGGDNVAEPPPSSAPGGGPPPGGMTSEPGAPSASSGSQAPTSQAPGSGKSPAPGSSAPPSGPGEAGPGDTDGADGAAGGQNGGRNGGPRGEGSANGQVRDSDVPVRVYNNSNVKNLATRAASDLRKQGWTVAEISNYPYGVIPATTAYYRKGTPEKAAALSLAAAFGMRAEPRFDGIRDASPGVVIIVTKNYHGPVGKSG